MGKGKKLLVGAALVGGAAMLAKKLKGKSKEEILAEAKKVKGKLSKAAKKVHEEVKRHKGACGCGSMKGKKVTPRQARGLRKGKQ